MCNKTAVITGAGERIGCAIAISLLEKGFSIIAHYRKNRSSLLAYLDENPKYGDRVTWWCASFPNDLTRVDEINWSEVSLLVNCASVFETGNLFENSSENNFENQFNINTLTPLKLIQAFKANGNSGSVINFIDGNIHQINSSFQNYRISKLILRELTRQTAATIGPNFRVNGIAPGTVLPPEGDEQASYQRARDKAPLKREPSLHSILSTLHFLIDNNDITGEIIAVDGGIHTL